MSGRAPRATPAAPRQRRFLDHPTPIPIAHRGGAEEFPENTLIAFESAVALGYRHLETDVHASRDGVVFAFHDDVLDRITDRRGRIADLDSAAVAGADAAFRFHPAAGFPLRGRGIGVPTLDEILSSWPDVFVNIDPKSDSALPALLKLLRQRGALDRVCVGSFSDARLRRIRQATNHRVCTSMGPRQVAAAWVASRGGRMHRFGADCIQVPVRARGVRIVDRRFVAAAHSVGLQVHVWTVDHPVQMNLLLDLGVDGLMTDRPSVLRRVLEVRGQWPASAWASASASASAPR